MPLPFVCAEGASYHEGWRASASPSNRGGVGPQRAARFVAPLARMGAAPRARPRPPLPPLLGALSGLGALGAAGHAGAGTHDPGAGACERPASRRRGAAPRPPAVRVARATRGRWPQGACANVHQVLRGSFGLERPGAGLHPCPPPGGLSWRGLSTRCPPRDDAGSRPRRPRGSPRRGGFGCAGRPRHARPAPACSAGKARASAAAVTRGAARRHRPAQATVTTPVVCGLPRTGLTQRRTGS